jgi:hypothetical protein
VAVVKGLLLVVRFGLELCALAALAYWGFSTNDGVLQIVAGVGTPVLALAAWSLFASPKAPYATPVRRALVEAAVFGAAAVALIAADSQGLAIVFAAVALVDGVLVRVIPGDPFETVAGSS